MTSEADRPEPDGRMTDFEAVMWTLDGDPRLSSAFANLTTLDRPPERAELRRRMLAATAVVPKLRQRVVEQPGPMSTPVWREDPSFDIDHHIRWIDLGDRDLDELVAELSARPFDRERPLWEFVVIEGLPDGCAAMVQRFDHTITDGEGGIRLSVQFLDLERSPGHRPGDATGSNRRRSTRPDAPRDPTGADTSGADPTGAVAEESGGAPTDRTRRAVEGLRALATAPAAAIRGVTDAFQQLAVDARRSTLWTGRSTERWFGRTALHLGDVKDAAHVLGGTVNDLFVTGALDAASRLHRDAGSPVEDLRVAIPISTRHDRSAGGNAFTPGHTLLPAGDVPIGERFGAVHERLSRVKRGQGSVPIDAAATAARLMPTSALVGLAARTAGAVDFVCSNVRAAPFDLFIAGARLEGNYPLGPLVNTAFNLTTMSYRGWLFLGLVVDPVAVGEPAALLAALEESYAALLLAGGVEGRRHPDRSAGP